MRDHLSTETGATGGTAAVDPALPPIVPTPRPWARLAAANLPVFLADHAICEQQAALNALALVGQYPQDESLVEGLTALAIEEITHLRRVVALMRRRGLSPAGKRANLWVQSLRARIDTRREPELQVDRLLVAALIEARSCERFARLVEETEDVEVSELLGELASAEARHWRLFHDLAARLLPAAELDRRWQHWLAIENELSRSTGRRPTVHG